MKKLVIIGAGGQGKVVSEIAQLNGYKKIVFLDDNADVSFCGKYPVTGKTNDFSNYSKWDFFVAVGNAKAREYITERLEENNLKIVTLIHPKAVISKTAKIGIGTVVMAGSVINAYATIGKGCIVNTSSSIDHDCIISDFVHISVGTHLAGTVTIGKRTWVGIGAIVNNNISICDDCMVGAGSVVVKNIDKAGTYIGVPATIM